MIYNRRALDVDVRPPWAIGTRLVAWVVTVALSWPLLNTVADLRVSLVVYTVGTAAVIVIELLQRRMTLSFLGTFIRAAQIACELIVISQVILHTGGLRSPSVFLYLMTIVSTAISYRLVGTLLVATVASAAYAMVIWYDAGQTLGPSGPAEWLSAVYQLSDEDFFAVFARICIFFLCAFTGGYLAERLSSKVEVLAHTTEALKVAKLETGDILQHLQSGILTVDLAGNIVFFNRAAGEILGVPVRKVRGRSLKDVLGSVSPELVDRLEAVRLSQKMDLRTELTLCRPDGRTIPLGFSTSVLGGVGGRPRGLISIFQDLTQAKKMEEKMRAQDRLAAIGELSAAIAHEIRNPLAAISGSVEVLSNELAVEDTNRRLLDLIIKESGRLNKILTDFLTYARIRPTVSGRVSVESVLEEVCEIAQHRFAGGKGITLRYRQPDRSLTVRADADHFKQMLINLVFNAAESIEGDSGEVVISAFLPIELALREPMLVPGSPHNWVAIAVADSGSGIPDDIRRRIFEPFVSTKAGGTGLGLAIVSRLVEQAGGQIHVDSTLGEGTTFTVILPRYKTIETRRDTESPETTPAMA